jgi:hypothetical protein
MKSVNKKVGSQGRKGARKLPRIAKMIRPNLDAQASPLASETFVIDERFPRKPGTLPPDNLKTYFTDEACEYLRTFRFGYIVDFGLEAVIHDVCKVIRKND